MNDPKHMTDEGSEATDFERELLEAAQGVRMAPREKQAIWAAIALAAAPTALVGSAAASTATSGKAALGSSSLLKGVLIALGVGGASLGGYWLTRPAAPDPAPAHAPLVAVPVASTWAEPSIEPPVVEAPRETAPIPVVVPSTANTRDVKSALRDESAAVLEIRRTLRAGDAGAALRLLEQARLRFPRGALSQEREALAIEALAKTGAKASASRRARLFLEHHPSSPYAADVQSFVSP